MTKDLPIDPEIVQLGSSNVKEAFAAIQALKSRGAGALPALMEAVKGEDTSIRTMAVVVLGELGPTAALSIPQLIRLLEEDNEQLRMAAALALVRIGEASASSLAAAVSSESSRKTRAWFWAAWALSFIDPAGIAEETVMRLDEVRTAGQSPIEMMAAEEAIGKVLAGKLRE